VIRNEIGAALLAVRKSSGFTQDEVAALMGTQASAISRVETGRAMPTLDFIERYTQSIGRPITLTMGSLVTPTWEQRIERMLLVYKGRLRQKGGRFYPPSADVILRVRKEVDPAELYVEMLERAERRVDGGLYEYSGRWENINLRGPIAVAAMYHDLIDWRSAKKLVPRHLTLLDAKTRRRARHVLAGAIDLTTSFTLP
jgi:transcriptional regulator with XRE-family HTH domain